MKNNKILIFDFDGTLTPHPITKFDILEKGGISGGVANPELWNLIRKRKQKETFMLLFMKSFWLL